MKKFALTVAAISMLATPALADTIHTSNPAVAKEVYSVTVASDTKQDFAATITPTAASSNPGKKSNFEGGHTFEPHELRGGR